MAGPDPSMHGCPACGRLIKKALFACHLDWFRLPAPFRRAITSAYLARKAGREGADGAHESAKAAGRRWFRDSPRGTS